MRSTDHHIRQVQYVIKELCYTLNHHLKCTRLVLEKRKEGGVMEMSNMMKHSDASVILWLLPIGKGKNLAGYVTLEKTPRLWLLIKGIAI